MNMSKEIIAGPGDYQKHEREAGADTDPGELVELEADDRVQPHSTEAGVAIGAFAVAFREVGKTIHDTHEYDAEEDEGDTVPFVFPAPGTKVPGALLAAGEDVEDGDPLVSAGDGTLQAAAGDGSEDAAIVAYSNEATDNAAGEEAIRHEVISA